MQELRLPNDVDLCKGNVTFETTSGHIVTVKAIWQAGSFKFDYEVADHSDPSFFRQFVGKLLPSFQDSLPSGSTMGTVFCVHGSPGSHNDFKYISHYLKGSGIRVVAVDFPGHGYTESQWKMFVVCTI